MVLVTVVRNEQSLNKFCFVMIIYPLMLIHIHMLVHRYVGSAPFASPTFISVATYTLLDL